MNYLWSGMILTGIIYACFHGTLPEVTTAALESAKEAVNLCITMLGVMSFWMGFMISKVSPLIYHNKTFNLDVFVSLSK